MTDLRDQLQQLFPDHKPENKEEENHSKPEVWVQDDPLICKYEKRKGKPMTIIEGYNGAKSDFKSLTRILQRELHVGGSFKDEIIYLQGDYRDKIMDILKTMGFKVKRVGG